jgi:hypothetical protein
LMVWALLGGFGVCYGGNSLLEGGRGNVKTLGRNSAQGFSDDDGISVALRVAVALGPKPPDWGVGPR